MSVAIRLNRQEEVKASLQGKAIGLSQLLRDELLRAGSAEREATVTFKLSICGKFVVEDDTTAHPIVWTLAEAGARGKRALETGAAYEKDADNFTRQGRDVEAKIAKSMAAFHLTQAADLLDVLRAADRLEAA